MRRRFEELVRKGGTEQVGDLLVTKLPNHGFYAVKRGFEPTHELFDIFKARELTTEQAVERFDALTDSARLEVIRTLATETGEAPMKVARTLDNNMHKNEGAEVTNRDTGGVVRNGHVYAQRLNAAMKASLSRSFEKSLAKSRKEDIAPKRSLLAGAIHDRLEKR